MLCKHSVIPVFDSMISWFMKVDFKKTSKTFGVDMEFLGVFSKSRQPRGSREYGHNLLPVDLMQGTRGESSGMAHRCDRQDALLPEAGKR